MKTNDKFVTFDPQDAVRINKALMDKRTQNTCVSAGSAAIIREMRFTAADINDAYKTAREQLTKTK